MKRKWVTVGIIFLFIGASALPNISANNGENKIDIRTSNKQTPADITITDWTEDVCSFSYYRNKWTIITNSTDIEVDNLDLVQTTFTQQGIQATVSLQVAGEIENRGQIDSWNNFNDTIDVVEYSFQLTTSEQNYIVSYINQTGVLIYGNVSVNLTSSDFTVLDNTLSITFPLVNLTETYENLSVNAIFVKANISSQPPFIMIIADTIPNYWEKVLLIGRYNSVDSRGAYMTLEVVRLWMIRFHPFQLIRYKPGEMIRISTPYKARIITDHFLLGMVDVLVL